VLTYLHEGYELAIDHPDHLPRDTPRMLARALLDSGGCMTLTIEGGTWTIAADDCRCTIRSAEKRP